MSATRFVTISVLVSVLCTIAIRFALKGEDLKIGDRVMVDYQWRSLVELVEKTEEWDKEHQRYRDEIKGYKNEIWVIVQKSDTGYRLYCKRYSYDEMNYRTVKDKDISDYVHIDEEKVSLLKSWGVE